MKKFLLRIFIILAVILLQLSFFNLIVSEDYQVNLSILLVIAWVIIGGFEKNLIWIFILGLLNDIFFTQKLGIDILFFTLIAYAVSFVSKRFIIERRFSGFLVIIIFIIGTSFLGNVLE
jgi:rod shape-determining protein MreD